MLIEKSQKPIKFNPIEIKITIESQEELEVLETIASFDTTIPNAIFKDDIKKNGIAKRFLDNLYSAICK